jgi:cytochrome oxidase Cu insertion factor (SCO1/SenC/PrrC family)
VLWGEAANTNFIGCRQYHQNEQSTLSYFIEQKEKKDQDNYMMLEIQVLAWDRNKYVAGLYRVMESQPFSLDNWIFKDKGLLY